MARKIGVKSDTKLDHLLKKVVAEAKTVPIPTAQASTSSSSRDVASAAIVEDDAAEKEEEAAADEEEAAAAARKVTPADDVNWQQADFGFEDAPAPWRELTLWLPSQTTPTRRSSVLEGNSDVLPFIIHPFTDLKAYVNSRHKRHSQTITSVGCGAAKDILLDIEQHSFMLVLLKVLATKGQSRLMPPSQIEKVNSHLSKYEKEFESNAREALGKVNLGGKDKDYVNAVETYAQSAHKLVTPVNVWMIPYPNGHKAVLVSPNELSLAFAAS